tara:strand:+ start:206 stop:1054 length:849 start_codon:yes stop_codon:yes gene_type:complete
MAKDNTKEINIMSEDNTKDRFYFNKELLESPQGRSIRILAEYYGPLKKIKKNRINDTIVFFGSARIKSPEQAEQDFKSLQNSNNDKDKLIAKKNIEMSKYYERANKLSKELTLWSKSLKSKKSRYIIASGGGGGIMEAANRGAHEAGGISIGLTISLPFESSGNKFITNDLDLKFHYFFMRKFWFMYLAKGIVVWPGGFGTLDEVMETLTLIQTKKITKKLPIVLFGKEFWNSVINWNYLVECGTISKEDLDLFLITDSIEKAFEYLTTNIQKDNLKGPNFT